MSDFLLGMFASIVGGIVLLLAAMLSRRWRKILISISGKLSGADIDYVFRNKADAQADMEKSIRGAKDVAILASRGNELQRDAFSSIFLHRPERRQIHVRILLPDTSLREGEYDWTGQREKELASFDAAFGGGLLHKQVGTIVAFLSPHVEARKVELRRFNAPHVGRVVLVDGTAYYTPYRADVHGRDSTVYKFARGGEMSRNLGRFFEQLWDAASEAGAKGTEGALASKDSKVVT